MGSGRHFENLIDLFKIIPLGFLLCPLYARKFSAPYTEQMNTEQDSFSLFSYSSKFQEILAPPTTPFEGS